jgi:hypothetical protein
VTDRRTPDAKLIEAVQILARTINTEDGVIAACLAEVAQRLAELVEERRWVPVGERLPADDVHVLIWGNGWRSPAIGWREHQPHYIVPETIWTLGDDVDRGDPPRDITHWQPLPPGPEGNGNG